MNILRNATIAVWMALAFLSTATTTALAQANCANVNNASLSSTTTITATPAYEPFSGSALTHSFNMTVQNTNTSTCAIAIVLNRPSSASPTMTSGASSLSWNLDFNGSPVLYDPGVLAGWYANVGANNTFTFSTYNMNFPANQTSAAAGAYTDTQVTLSIYAFRFGWRFVRSYAMTFGASIDRTCIMSAPSPSSLNFSSAISLGMPNPAAVLSSTISGVNCTSPARVTLSGNAMQRTPSVGTVSGFDSFIDWQATATLGSATATLATNAASTTTSVSYNVGSGTTVGGAVGVDVNLIAGQPLRSGSYSAVLSVTVDPTL